jgi:hypothetical protein
LELQKLPGAFNRLEFSKMGHITTEATDSLFLDGFLPVESC